MKRCTEIGGVSFVLCLALVCTGVSGQEPRIVGGKEAKLGQFPYQISMIRYNQHWCGASLISHNYVLTASHCVSDTKDGVLEIISASDVKVRAGSVHLNLHGIVVDVAEIKVNPKYDFPNYDVTLLRLAEPLEYSRTIQAIPLAKEQPAPGAKLTVSGWGYLSTNGRNPELLQYIHLKVLSDEKCTKDLRANRDTVFCGEHQPGQGICQGDSGGPAQYNGTLLGVVSFTPGSCENSLPDGFAKVAVLNSWIIENSDLGDSDDDATTMIMVMMTTNKSRLGLFD